MVDKNFDNLNAFFDKVKSVGFFERVFSWKSVVELSYEAHSEFKYMDEKFEAISKKCDDIERGKESAEEKLKHISEIRATLETDKRVLESKRDDLTEKTKSLEKQISMLEEKEKNIREEQQKQVEKLQTYQEDLQKEKLRLQEEREQEIKLKFEEMKKTWKKHEEFVEQQIKLICKRHSINFIDKVPFKGKPDNCLEIAEEYVIFDSKSPANDNLDNFPKYLKEQAEKLKKYAKEKNVKKELFLVIPNNTVEVIKDFYYNQVDYDVHIVTVDALEPIILSLRKIEDYQFAEQLRPEDRAHICRVIGKFAHVSKRRIQVDHFFANEWIDILKKCEDLPKDILDGAVEAERSGKLNPPTERKAKQISNGDIEKKSKKLKREAEAQEIDMGADLEVIDSVPLHKEVE